MTDSTKEDMERRKECQDAVCYFRSTKKCTIFNVKHKGVLLIQFHGITQLVLRIILVPLSFAVTSLLS